MTIDPFQSDGVTVHFDDHQYLVLRHPDGRGVRLSQTFITWAARELPRHPAPIETEEVRNITFLDPKADRRCASQ